MRFILFVKPSATTDLYTLSLHDALPIWSRAAPPRARGGRRSRSRRRPSCRGGPRSRSSSRGSSRPWTSPRSEEHTSELQSHSDLVCRLLLEKKKRNQQIRRTKLQTKNRA